MSTLPPSTIFERLGTYLAAAPEEASEVGIAVTFELSGEGGGSWTVDCRGYPTVLSGSANVKPDCRVRLAAADFDSIVSGRMNPQEAFLAGRVSLDGDLTKLLKFNVLLDKMGEFAS